MTKEELKEKIKGISKEDRENLIEALGIVPDSELIAEINRLQSELAEKSKIETVTTDKKKKSFFDDLFGG